MQLQFKPKERLFGQKNLLEENLGWEELSQLGEYQATLSAKETEATLNLYLASFLPPDLVQIITSYCYVSLGLENPLFREEYQRNTPCERISFLERGTRWFTRRNLFSLEDLMHFMHFLDRNVSICAQAGFSFVPNHGVHHPAIVFESFHSKHHLEILWSAATIRLQSSFPLLSITRIHYIIMAEGSLLVENMGGKVLHKPFSSILQVLQFVVMQFTTEN